MQTLRIAAFLFLAIALVVGAIGISTPYNAVESWDDACDDINDCHDRNVRATKLEQLGTNLVLGALFALVAAGALFVFDRKLPQA